jgi:hypothetical protein
MPDASCPPPLITDVGLWRETVIMDSIRIARFIRAIRALPSDQPRETPGKWYRTQKEHWLGWLAEYHGPGAYGRAGTTRRDAEFAYNHIVEVKMLTWLIEAAGVSPALVRRAQRSVAAATSLQQKAAAVRRHVPWQVLKGVLFGSEKPNSVQRTRLTPRC